MEKSNRKAVIGDMVGEVVEFGVYGVNGYRPVSREYTMPGKCGDLGQLAHFSVMRFGDLIQVGEKYFIAAPTQANLHGDAYETWGEVELPADYGSRCCANCALCLTAENGAPYCQTNGVSVQMDHRCGSWKDKEGIEK